MDKRPEKITLDRVRDELLKVLLTNEDDKETIRVMLEKYDAHVLSEVDPKHYKQLLEDCQLEIQKLTGGLHD